MALYFKNQPIENIYVLDWDNEQNPESMRGKTFYKCPANPAANATKSGFEDMLALAYSLAERIGGGGNRISFFLELGPEEPLIEVIDQVLDAMTDC